MGYLNDMNYPYMGHKIALSIGKQDGLCRTEPNYSLFGLHDSHNKRFESSLCDKEKR